MTISLRNDIMRIGFNCSTFDLFHAGHVTMLKVEKEQCDYLIIALQTDPTIDRPDSKNKPIQSIYERFVQVSACKYVDEVLVYETEEDLLHLIQTTTMDVRFLGDEYRIKDFTGKQWCIDNGIELFYHKREHPYSSSQLRTRTWEAEQRKRGVNNDICEKYKLVDGGGCSPPVWGSVNESSTDNRSTLWGEK